MQVADNFAFMETITISKKEYQALKRAARELLQYVGKARQRAPKNRLKALPDQDALLLKLSERSFEFWNNADDSIYDRL
jgi:hypothetical protein